MPESIPPGSSASAFPPSDGVPGWFGGALAAGRGGPAEGAVGQLFDLPAGVLLEAMVMAALRRVFSKMTHVRPPPQQDRVWLGSWTGCRCRTPPAQVAGAAFGARWQPGDQVRPALVVAGFNCRHSRSCSGVRDGAVDVLTASRAIADGQDRFELLLRCAADRGRPAGAVYPGRPMAGDGMPDRPRPVLAAAVAARRPASRDARRSHAQQL